MPRPPSSHKRLPAGLLATAALDILDNTPVGDAFLERILGRGAPGAEVRLPAGEPIHLRRRPVETEMP